MLANLKKFITKTAEAKASREIQAEAEYAALLGKIAADGEIGDGEVEEESQAVLALLDELGRTLDDVEKDAKVYIERQECVARHSRLESLTALKAKAKAASDKAEREYQDAISRLNKLRFDAAAVYDQASQQVSDAKHAGDRLRDLLPSWMRREQRRIDHLPRPQLDHDGELASAMRVSEHPDVIKAELLARAAETVAWPLPKPKAEPQSESAGETESE